MVFFVILYYYAFWFSEESLCLFRNGIYKLSQSNNFFEIFWRIQKEKEILVRK